MFDCILLLAGSGRRTGLDINKIMYEINGRPLYEYPLNTFLNIKECNKIILVVRSDEYDYFHALEKKNDRIKVVLGGLRRQDSVLNGIMKVESDYVLVHDGARANIKRKDILNVYEACLKYDCAALAVRENNALKKVKDNFVECDIDRSDIYCMQTPQAARTELLKNALMMIDEDVFDDIEAINKIFNKKAFIVLGDCTNIKFTTMDDARYLSYLLKEEEK